MIHGFDLKGAAGVPGFVPDGEARLLEYESRKPIYLKTVAQARGFELGKVLLQRKPNWAGVITLDSSECAWHLLFNVPEGIAIKSTMVNPYETVLKAMKCVPDFFNTAAVEFKKMKGRNGMRYLEYKPEK